MVKISPPTIHNHIKTILPSILIGQGRAGGGEGGYLYPILIP